MGERIAGALAVTMVVAILWITVVSPLPATAVLIPLTLAVFAVFEVNARFSLLVMPCCFLCFVVVRWHMLIPYNEVSEQAVYKLIGESKYSNG